MFAGDARDRITRRRESIVQEVLNAIVDRAKLALQQTTLFAVDAKEIRRKIQDASFFGRLVRRNLVTRGSQLDGNDDTIAIGSDSSLNLNNDFSISSWVNIPSSRSYGTGGIVSWGQNSTGKRRSLIFWNEGGPLNSL